MAKSRRKNFIFDNVTADQLAWLSKYLGITETRVIEHLIAQAYWQSNHTGESKILSKEGKVDNGEPRT